MTCSNTSCREEGEEGEEREVWPGNIAMEGRREHGRQLGPSAPQTCRATVQPRRILLPSMHCTHLQGPGLNGDVERGRDGEQSHEGGGPVAHVGDDEHAGVKVEVQLPVAQVGDRAPASATNSIVTEAGVEGHRQLAVSAGLQPHLWRRGRRRGMAR